MKNNINLKNIDDLIYMQSACFENLNKNELNSISLTYMKMLKKIKNT
jgi:hypothetical protein